MTYKKYTNCVQPENFIDLGFTSNGIRNIILLLLTTGPIAFIAIILAGNLTDRALIMGAIALVAPLSTFLYWWLNGRLICLGDDSRNCAIIGMVMSAGASDTRKKAGDNDFTMNVLLALAPTHVEFNSENKLILAEPKEAYWEPPLGHLVAENPKILGIQQGYVQGKTLDRKLNYMKAIHCEFEGDGIHTLLMASYLVTALLFAAFLLGAFSLVIVAVIIALLAVWSKIFSSEARAGTAPGAGTPLDVNPNLGDLNLGDVVVFKGEWVYDSLHDGWNEIHPMHCCEKLDWFEKPDKLILPDGSFDITKFEWKDFKWQEPGTDTVFTIDSITNFELLHTHWCAVLQHAEDAENKGNKSNPEHDWGIHPAVDGCKPPIIVP
jgi:hypothetical protein